jgi:hypothetical protein
MSAAEVIVNECKVFATAGGAAWWAAFRTYQPQSRFRVITASIGGDRVAVACADAGHAAELAAMFVERGLPASAVSVSKR